MKLRIEIDMDGAAFEECNGDEVARVLRDVADRIDGADLFAAPVSLYPSEPADVLMDSNGNTCGRVEVVK